MLNPATDTLAANNIKAALMIIAASLMITTNDAIVKHLTQVFGIGQIMFIRGFLACCIFACVLHLRKQPVFSRRIVNRWNIARALLELSATFAFLTGLTLLPLAINSTLGFASPIFLAIFAMLFLGERVNWKRWLAILAGFSGVLLITNPFNDSATWAVLFPITCAVFVALRDLVIRYVPQDLPSLQVAFTNAWIVMLGGGVLALFQGWSTPDIEWFYWFGGLAIAIYGGYLFYIMGTRLGELSFVAPFKYTSILLAIVFGYLFWGEKLTPVMFAGAGIIVISGILLLNSERKGVTRN